MNETPTVPPAPPRIRRGQRIALALLMVSGIVNYLDRGTLAVASSAIRADLGLSLAQMGLLLSAFSWSYALCQFPVGGLVDRIGPRRLLGIGLIVWSIAQAAAVSCRPLAGSSSRASCSASARRRSSRRPRGW